MGRKLIITAIVALFLFHESFSQGFYTDFGQNRIQHRDFSWQFYETDNYRIYFHSGGQDMARFAIFKANEYLSDLERTFDYNMRNRSEIILFNNITDYRQSNLSLAANLSERNPGGRTELRDNKAHVVFNGNYRDFDDQLKIAIARGLFNEMLYGGDTRERVQNATLIHIPYWHNEGILRYAATEWKTEDHERFKNIVQRGHLFNIHYLSREEQAIAGEHFWNYLEKQYSRSALSNVFYMIRINKSFEGSFQFVLGKSLNELVREWEAYSYEKYYSNDREDENHTPLKDFKIKELPSDFSVNAQNNKIAFITQEMGRQKLWISDETTEETIHIRTWNYRTDKLPEDLSQPVINWHPRRDELVLFFEEDGRLFYTIYDYQEEEFENEIAIDRLDKVLDFDIHPNGRTVILSGTRGTLTNIFTFDLNTRRLNAVTNDFYTDLHPVFVRDGDHVLFSSNRKTQDIREASNNPAEARYNQHFNIFFYDFSARNPRLKSITNNESLNQIKPVEYDEKYFGYLTNDNGAYNRNAAFLDSIFQHIRVVATFEKELEFADHPRDTFRFYQNDTAAIYLPPEITEDTTLLEIDTSFIYRDFVEHYPLTNHQRSIKFYNINKHRREITALNYKNGNYSISKSRYSEDFTEHTTDRTPVSGYEDIALISDYWLEHMLEEDITEDVDTPDEDYYFITDFHDPETLIADDFMERTWESEDQEPEPDEKFEIPSSRMYSTSFRANMFTGQLDNSILTSPYKPFDPDDDFVYDPTMNAMMEIVLQDRLENYKIQAGAGLSLDLSGIDLYASFSNNSNRLNRQYIYFRESSLSGDLSNRNRINSDELRTRLTWPFTETRAVRGDIFLRHQNRTYLSIDQEMLERPDDQQVWGGLKAEYIWDNTKSLGNNIPWGHRMKVYGEMFGNIGDRDESFTIIGGDFRKYFKLHRNLILATRFAGATTIGSENLIFFMGGVENWFLPRYNDEIAVGDQNYAFKTNATPMRGFRQNIRNGTSFALLNTEIRWPMFQYFSGQIIRSDFLRDFQFVSFADVGTAWHGLLPDREISEVVTTMPSADGPIITITHTPLRNPVVWGYGAGIRTSFLGYFLKIDYAWGMEDFTEIDRNLYLSLGLDF